MAFDQAETPLLRLEYVDPAFLTGNPANWRTHPPEQRRTFEALLAEVGWSDVIRFNELTGRLVDGHMRTEEARRLGLPAVPVVFGRWSEAQERKILGSADTLGMMAGYDPAAWSELVHSIDSASPELADLLTGLSETFGTIPGGSADSSAEDLDPAAEDPAAEDLDPVEKVPDLVHASDNPWGVPTLDPRHQAVGIVFPFAVWGCQGQRVAMRGTYAFYNADERLAALWNDPHKVYHSGAVALVEVNYSTHPQMPAACVLYDVFRKRWLARTWQTQGKKIFVDLNVCPEFRALNFLGVPKGWRAYATRSHDKGIHVEAEHAAACEHAGTEDLVFVVYGGGKSLQALCNERHWHWIPERVEYRDGKDVFDG